MTTSCGTGRKSGGRLVRSWWWGVAGLAVAVLVSGCAAPTPIVRAAPRDLRGNAIVAGREAQPLVTGPMKLLHVNSDGRTAPRFSHVWQRDGAVDCQNGTPLEWDGESAVVIGKDELVCVSADGPARLSWHGRSIARRRPAVPQQASLR